MKKDKKLVKYLRGTSKALAVLADDVDEAGEFDKESEELMSKIGAELLFHAKTFTYLK